MDTKLTAEPIIEVEAPRRLPPHASCGNCFYGKLEPQQDGTIDIKLRTCYRFPPSGQIIMMQTARGVAQQYASVFPPVQSRSRCHEWAPQDRDHNIIGAIPQAEGKAN